MGLTEGICIEVIVVICNLWKTFQVYQPIITATNKQLEANGNQASLFNYVIELIKIGPKSKNRSSEKKCGCVCRCVCLLFACIGGRVWLCTPLLEGAGQTVHSCGGAQAEQHLETKVSQQRLLSPRADMTVLVLLGLCGGTPKACVIESNICPCADPSNT